MSAWERFWFAPDARTATRLALARVLLGLAAIAKLTGAYGLVARTMQGHARFGLPLHRWSAKSWPFHELHERVLDVIPAMSRATHAHLETLALVLALLFALGLCGRLAGVLLGASLVWMVSFDATAFKHNGWTLGIACLVVGLAPCVDRFSLDARLWRLLGRSAPRERSALPVRMLQALVCALYAFSTLAKLNASWLAGGMFASFAHDRRMVHTALDPLVQAHATHVVAGIAVVVAEAFLAFGLAWRRTRTAALVVGALLHVGIEVTMDVGAFSFTMLALYAVFLEPRRAASASAV